MSVSNSCAVMHIFCNVKQDGGQLQNTYCRLFRFTKKSSKSSSHHPNNTIRFIISSKGPSLGISGRAKSLCSTKGLCRGGPMRGLCLKHRILLYPLPTLATYGGLFRSIEMLKACLHEGRVTLAVGLPY